jgi:hypothetical protein
MANVSLPTPQSQARVTAPSRSLPSQPSALQQTLAALPGIANTFIRASEKQTALKRQAQLDTQAAEDKQAVGQAIFTANELAIQKQEASNTQNDLQTLAASVNTRFADGEITAEDKAVQTQYLSAFASFKNANEQGLLSPGEFNTKALAAKRRFMSENMHLAPEIEAAFSTLTGKAPSATTGAVTQRQLAFQNRMENIYQGDITPERVLKEQSKVAIIQDLEQNKALGVVSFGQVVTDNNKALNIGIDTLTARAATAYGQKQALDQNELDGLDAQLTQLERALNRGIDQEVARLRQNGEIVDPSTTSTQKERNSKQIADLRLSFHDKDLQKMLQKREQLDTSMWKNGLGGQIDRINSVASILGDGGITALTASLNATNPQQAQAIASLAASSGTDPSFLANTKQLMIDAASRIASPDPVPGFSKLDAWYGLGAQKAGETTDQVKMNTLTNINNLVIDVDDVAGAVKQLNEPRVSAGYIGAGKEATNQLIQSTNAWDTITVDSINQRNLDVTFDNDTQRFVVSNVQLVNSSSFIPKEGVVVYRQQTKDLNSLYDLHRNPNYGSILQPAEKWLADVLARTTNNNISETASE